MAIHIDIQVEQWRIERLIPRVTNPRTHSAHQIAQIAASMRQWGWTNPVLVGTEGDIVAGHARVLAARLLGMTEVPVIVLRRLSEAQRRALVIADNQLALNAGWDEELLRVELAALKEEDFDLDLLGFDDGELAQLLAEEQAAAAVVDEDETPEAPLVATSIPGDLWVMGSHRLLCGDACQPESVSRLTNGELAGLVFTDPPYNVDYEGYTGEHLKIAGDQMTAAEFRKFLGQMARNCRAVMRPDASLYICHASSWQREFQNALEAAGLQIRCQIIWAKNTFAWGFGRYKFQHEPIFYCHLGGHKDAWYGDKTQSTLWQQNKPSANRLHPTMKPVELVERALGNSSRAGEVVVDLFGGSGSTLIGCERQGRSARLMEIDPRYADVICRRWEAYTGKSAVLDGEGQAFAEVALARCRKAA